METFETSKMSRNGQVVIPEPIRKLLHLEPGTQFAVVTVNGSILFKPIPPPSKEQIAEFWADLVTKAGEFTKKAGITEEDVARATKEVREAKRREKNRS